VSPTSLQVLRTAQRDIQRVIARHRFGGGSYDANWYSPLELVQLWGIRGVRR
jgi:hypothetical protein